MFLTLFIVALLIGYIALIKADAFELIEKAGIDTSGRVKIYNAVDDLYDFTPAFLGLHIAAPFACVMRFSLRTCIYAYLAVCA